MATTDNVTILRVQLDEGKTEEQLAKLVLDIEATKRAQSDLNIMRKAGVVNDEAYAKQTVALRSELKSQQVEQTALTKNLDLYRKATGELGNTYQGVQAQLSLAQNQFKLLEGSAENGTEATQALSGVIDGLRNTLKDTDAQQSLFVRNVGNYPDGKELTGLIQQLVKLEEQTKAATLSTEEANRAQMQIAGFRTQAMQAAAKEGLSYEQTEARLKDYAAAIRPATTALVALEKEQDAVAASGGGTEEQVRRIGFQMVKLEKSIKEVPPEAKKLSTGLKEVAGQNSLVSAATEKYTSAKEKFVQVTNLAKLALGGQVTVLGALRLAIIATGLGALVVVLGSLIVFLTKTAEGTRLVENVMAKVGAVVNVVIDRLGALGKAVTQVLSGDFNAAATTARAAMSGIGDELSREVKIAGDLSKARQQLERDTTNNIDTNKRLLNEVERLRNVRDNEFNTLQVRKKANEDAFVIELRREKTLADLARRRVALLKAEIDQRGGESKVSLEQLKEYKEAQNELVDVLEDAAGKQNELITNRFQLNKDGLDKEKEAAATSEGLRKKRDEDMLKSIEAEIAAGKSREEAAAAYLANEDKARATAAARETQRLADAKAENTAAYQAGLASLERNLEARRVVLETSYAEGAISKAQYERGLTVIDEGGYAARLLVARHYNQDLTALQQEQTRAHNAELLKQAEAAQAEQSERVAQAEQLTGALTALFADTVATTGATLEDFLGKALILIIDAMEKTLVAAQVKIIAEALATPQSAATFGVAGFAQAAATIAAVTVASQGLKALLTPAPKQFAAGGVLGGPSHAQGGVQLYSRGGHHFGEAEGNEVVLTKGVWNNPLLRPMASMLNQMGGGRALLPGRHLALGGVISSQAAGQLRGEVGPGLDYSRLAQAMSRVKVKATISDVKAGLERDAFTDSLANS